jgi:hypothetical protein
MSLIAQTVPLRSDSVVLAGFSRPLNTASGQLPPQHLGTEHTDRCTDHAVSWQSERILESAALLFTPKRRLDANRQNLCRNLKSAIHHTGSSEKPNARFQENCEAAA